MESSHDQTLPIVWQDGPNSLEYEKERSRVFNAKVPARYPRAIVKPRTLSDVVAAVELAKRLDVRVSIRSGGHSWACWSIRDNSILSDFVDFKHISYDDDTKIVQASPGTLSKEVCAFLSSKKRFVPVGHCGTVGIGGFLLQGGMGLNARSYGWACEYIVGIDVVTADGQIKHCSEYENSDLFWAARGAGPGFPAVVTRFYIKTKPAFLVYKRSVYLYPIAKYDQVMRWILGIIPTINEDIEPLITSFFPPDSDQIVLMVMATVFASAEEEALSKLKPLIESHPPGTVSAVDFEDTSLQAQYDFGETVFVPGKRHLADNLYIGQQQNLVEVCRKAFTQLPAKGASAYLEPMNPVSRKPLKDMALSLHTDHYVAMYASYDSASEDAFHQSWLREYMLELEPYSVGSYLGDSDFQAHSTKYWSDEACIKLAAIRKKWDPSRTICGYFTGNDDSIRDELAVIMTPTMFGNSSSLKM